MKVYKLTPIHLQYIDKNIYVFILTLYFSIYIFIDFFKKHVYNNQTYKILTYFLRHAGHVSGIRNTNHRSYFVI